MAINQWDRGSDYNGPNAYKKGNRTNSRRDPAAAVEFIKEKSQDISAYKQAAEKYRKSKKYKQEDLIDIYSRIKAYVKECRETTDDDGNQRPITVAGLILAAGISKTVWYKMLSGEYDYRLFEYIDLHSIDIDNISDTINGIKYVKDGDNNIILLITYKEILEKAMLMVEIQTEERLYRKGRVGDIFALKAVHGWQEEQPQTVNNTLVIASEEQARKAIQLLK